MKSDNSTPVKLPEDTDATQDPQTIDLSTLDLSKLFVFKSHYKDRLANQNPYRLPKKKVNRFWYNGKLVAKEEFDKLTVEQRLESNNKVGGPR